MINPSATSLARLAPVLALFSCAAPKATVVEPPTAPPQEVAKNPEPDGPAEPANPTLPNDGLRLPDMVTLPGDDEFRTTHKPSSATGAGAVIARPPTDPPSRPKPEDE